MNLLQDIITYVRRIIKSPSNAQITDALLIDYINRFWIMDVDARIQLFDLKTKYQFQTVPGYDQYNMPLYSIQTEPGSQSINFYPVYQGFTAPAFINGVQIPLQTDRSGFFNIWPNVVQQLQGVAIGDGGSTYNFTLPLSPNNTTPLNIPIEYLLRGHVDMAGIIATGSNTDPPISSTLNTNIPTTSIYPAFYLTSVRSDGSSIVVSDSGQFLTSAIGGQNLGMLMQPGSAPFGNQALSGNYVNTFAITGVTQASQAVVTATTNFNVGQLVTINAVNGMTELNGNTYTVVAVDPTTVTLDVDSTGFTAYTSGGNISSIHNFVNYFTGEVRVTFPDNIPEGVSINAQCYLFQSGLPRAVLFNNNTLTFRSPPDQQYLVELDAYLTPSAFLSTSQAVPYAYMSEYIARGAARKILADTGDWEQFDRYEPLFIEQEQLVWKRSQRQFTATRSQTIYSQGINQGQSGFTNLGGSTI